MFVSFIGGAGRTIQSRHDLFTCVTIGPFVSEHNAHAHVLLSCQWLRLKQLKEFLEFVVALNVNLTERERGPDEAIQNLS